MNLIQRIVKRIFFTADQRYLLEMYNHGYIYETGFMKSSQLKEVVFADGSPAPWFNYSFIDFLAPRLKNTFYIFEFGLGNSTRYFNKASSHCYGVDHDPVWFDKVVTEECVQENYFLRNDKAYVNSIEKTVQKFDVVVVDGILRNECVQKGVDFLTEDGVLILDDSERAEYQAGISHLLNKGFKEIRISGVKALGRHYSCTSVFYRSQNCIGI